MNNLKETKIVYSHPYLVIYPSGELKWAWIDSVPYDFDPSCSGPSLDQIHGIIGCSCVEQVNSWIPGVVFLCDESGKIKTPPQPLNQLASRLYLGSEYGDFIHGPIVLFGLERSGPYDELDLAPLSHADCEFVAEYLGLSLPDLD